MVEPTFILWLWRGWRPIYDHRHVNRVVRQLKQHMSIPYKVVCITNDARGVQCETHPLWPAPEVTLPRNPRKRVQDTSRQPNCFLRLALFNPAVGARFGSTLVSLDIDCTIKQDLAPLLTDDSFKASRGYRSHICGSMWQLQVGAHEDVWRDFDPIEVPKQIAAADVQYRGKTTRLSGSDQAWMSIKMPNAPLWDEDDGVYQYLEMSTRERRRPAQNARVFFFAGSAKPWDRELQMEWSPLYDPLPQL